MSNQPVFINKLINNLSNIGETKTFAKGDYLIREGEIEKNLYWVESGAVRVFYLTEFEEQVIRLGYKDSFINSLSSFIKQTPSEFFVEAIRKTTVKVISKEQLQTLVHANNDNLKQYLALMEILVTQQMDREIDLLITSPAERLKRVLARSPNLFQEIPLKYIASYLRMKPETLSRIRNS
jgi:CRP-like cAMP-binding protein